jgi:hypothetical protein
LVLVSVLSLLGTTPKNKGNPSPIYSTPLANTVANQYILRAFIPGQTAGAFGRVFAGDNRTFSDQPGASSRVALTVLVSGGASRYTSSYGETKQLDHNGKVMKHDQASSGIFPPTISLQTKTTTIMAKFRAKNPLTPSFFTPSISLDAAICAYSAGIVVADGEFSQFPAFELNVYGNHSPVNIRLRNPRKGAGPLDLFKPNTQVFEVAFIHYREQAP